MNFRYGSKGKFTASTASMREEEHDSDENDRMTGRLKT